MMNDRISIKADREYLREIFGKIDSGMYAVPVFQRDYVWKKNQIIELFDSILRGYPIGSLVLWKSSDHIQSKHILTDEVLDVPVPDYFILDGRQRLTTLYGVVSSDANKDSRFELFFNLERQSFEYAQKEQPNLIKVSVIYDTFLLLDWMRAIPLIIKSKEKLHSYIVRAKNLNSILQEYIVSEILISQCSLSEASVVFSRINSKGTKIEAMDMLQAVKYQGAHSDLISSSVQKIQRRLQEFSFQDLSPKDILNCCFWYTDRKYYDSKIESLDKEDLDEIFPKVEDALVRTVSFLYNHCGVISSRLLPYTKQLLALAWVFKDEDIVDQARLNELRKWFFYTTYCQSFMNGALQHIRIIHARLEEFILGFKETAWDYSPVASPKFDFRFSSRSALTRFMVLAIIYRIRESNISLKDVTFVGYDHVYEGLTPLSYVPRILVAGRKFDDKEVMDLLLNSEDIMTHRRQRLTEMCAHLLESVGIEIETPESA